MMLTYSMASVWDWLVSVDWTQVQLVEDVLLKAGGMAGGAALIWSKVREALAKSARARACSKKNAGLASLLGQAQTSVSEVPA